ncbi:MAG: hypothetical protein AABX13_01270 [Nanoarchaeota archaeon]
MNNLISLIPRKVPPQGLRTNKHDGEKIKQFFFQDEWEKLSWLKQLPNFPNKEVSVLYPGSGADLFWPLYYLEHLFPKLEKANLLFVDLYPVQEAIRTILDDAGLSFGEEPGKERDGEERKALSFYWKEILVTLTCREGNIFEIISTLPSSLPHFNLYFERAFRIMKEPHPDYEQNIVEKLAGGGMVVSDSGFQNTLLRKINIPAELSAYGEMVVGVKG